MSKKEGGLVVCLMKARIGDEHLVLTTPDGIEIFISMNEHKGNAIDLYIQTDKEVKVKRARGVIRAKI